MIANSALRASLAIFHLISGPTRAHGIIVKYENNNNNNNDATTTITTKQDKEYQMIFCGHLQAVRLFLRAREVIKFALRTAITLEITRRPEASPSEIFL